YTLVVENTGNVTITDPVVTDIGETGTILSAPTETGGTGTNGDGVLDPGETWTYTYSHTVTQAEIDSQGGDGDFTLDNTAEVKSALLDLDQSDSNSVDIVYNPAVTIDKSNDSSGPVAAGDEINY